MFPRKLHKFARCRACLLPRTHFICSCRARAKEETAPVEATPPPVNEEFKFGEVDLEMLEQADLLDRSALSAMASCLPTNRRMLICFASGNR